MAVTRNYLISKVGWRTAALALCLVFLSTQAGQGVETNAPTYFNNYFLTGDFAVGGVGITGLASSNGLRTADIVMSSVPSDVSPVAAYLYWGTVVPGTDATAGLDGALFRNQALTPVTTVL